MSKSAKKCQEVPEVGHLFIKNSSIVSNMKNISDHIYIICVLRSTHIYNIFICTPIIYFLFYYSTPCRFKVGHLITFMKNGRYLYGR